MAYLQTVKLVTGDTLPDLRLVIKDANTAQTGKTYDENDPDTWAVQDLRDGSGKLYIRELGSTAIIKTILGVLADPENGAIVFSFANNPFTEPGLYEGEVEITFQDGGIQTIYDLIKFNVRGEFA